MARAGRGVTEARDVALTRGALDSAAGARTCGRDTGTVFLTVSRCALSCHRVSTSTSLWVALGLDAQIVRGSTLNLVPHTACAVDARGGVTQVCS